MFIHVCLSNLAKVAVLFAATYETVCRGILALILMKVMTMRYLVLLIAILSASCSSTLPSFKPYHLDVQQGNVVTSKMMLQLKPGMSKSQVRYVMGTPLLQDSFHQDRWDYLYQMNKGGQVIERRRVILGFKNDGLASVRGDVIQAGSPGAENAPIASIDDVKTAKSDKTLLAEDAKASWTDRFKFWNDDEKTKASKAEAAKAEKLAVKEEAKTSWLDSLQFWKSDKPAVAKAAEAPKVVEVAKPVEVVKAVEPEQVAAPVVAEQPVVAEAPSQPALVEGIKEVVNVEPQQKVVDEAAPADAKAEIAAMVSAWAEAWRTKNVNAYLNFYSDKFIPESGSRKAWLAQRKQRLAGQSGTIGLKLENVVIDVNGKSARVEFLQHYSNGKFADHVSKVLSLNNAQQKWLIVKEAVATKSAKSEVSDDTPAVEVFKIRDVTADEKSEAMPEKMIQESAKKALESTPVAKPATKPVEVAKPAVKEVPPPAKVEPSKAEVSKLESNKDKPLPPEDAPGYFERMLEKIGF